MAAPQLFYEPAETIIAECKALVESIIGKTILPAQVEMQIVLAFANREILVRAQADYAVSQMLVDFATAPMLDYLAANAGVVRLDATPAVTDILFTLVPGHGGVIIPAGTRVSTVDGNVVFATDLETAISAGTNSVEVPVTATSDGLSGNNYGPGTVSVIIDAQPFLLSASNVTTTAAGSEQETDVGLRARIKLAPSQYSVAGPVNAYKFFARSANPNIIDVAVPNPPEDAGVVKVYPLVAGGIETPEAILDAVRAQLDPETVIPIGDTVEVYSPEKVEYTLTVNIVLLDGAVQNTTVNRVIAAISQYCTTRANQLGVDITNSQLQAVAMNESVHSLEFEGFTALIVSPIEFPVCTAIYQGSVTYEDPTA